MKERYFIEPDTKFIKEVIHLGGESLKKCFQCGSCTVVCPLSPADNPYPGKEMIWSQWGLKDRLLKDPDIWLCRRCTECSTYCPRGAKPGDVLAALRSHAIMHYAVPRFLAKAFSLPKYLPALLAIPAVLLLGFLWALGDLTFPEGEIIFRNFIPISHGYIGMGITIAFVFTVATVGAIKFWKNINEFETNLASTSGTKESLPRSFLSSLVDVLKHSDFNKCVASKLSYYTHLGIFYGFVLILLSAFLGAVYNLAGIESPHPLTGPVKIVGNTGAVLLLAGCTLAIYRRLSKNSNMGKTTYFDWFLILTLFFVTISGIATEVARLAELATASYWLYLAHLWLMFVLLIYAPFSKGAHLLYGTLAMTYAKQIGRGAE